MRGSRSRMRSSTIRTRRRRMCSLTTSPRRRRSHSTRGLWSCSAEPCQADVSSQLREACDARQCHIDSIVERPSISCDLAQAGAGDGGFRSPLALDGAVAGTIALEARPPDRQRLLDKNLTDITESD